MIPKNAGNEEKQLKVLNFAAEKTDDNCHRYCDDNDTFSDLGHKVDSFQFAGIAKALHLLLPL